jgi:hypothetical protein
LLAVGSTAQRAPLLGRVELKIQAVPGAPVSFAALDMAVCDNGFAAMTVQANGDGYAHMNISFPPGCAGPTHVVVASPVCTGRIDYTFYVANESAQEP